jgi:hypothetical protein
MIDLLKLEIGTRLRLIDERIAEVVENMGDGQWVLARIIAQHDRADDVGNEELLHAQDIIDIEAKIEPGNDV